MPDKARRGGLALLITVGTAALGFAYVAYLNATPFPPAIARGIPFVWLVGALIGLILALSALSQGFKNRRNLSVFAVGIITLLLALPNTMLAALFIFGALFGD